MGKSTPQTMTSTQQTDMGPWSAQQPYLTKVFSEAERLYDTHNPKYFEKSTVAGATPAMTQGWDQAIRRAQQGSPLIPAAQGMTLDTINGKYLDPNSNPFLAATYGAAADQVTNAYRTATAPGTAAAYSAAGRYGSGARNQAVDQNNRGLLDKLNTLATSIYGGNYEAERQRQMTAAGGAPGMTQAGYIEPGILTSIGQQQQGQNQNELNDEVARWNYDQNLPYEKLARLLGAVQGSYGQSGTTTSTQTMPMYQNGVGSALGGLMSLGSMIGSFATPGLGGISAFGNLFGGAAGAGSSLGGMLGPLALAGSDIRIKENVSEIGQTFDGQPLYLFNYIGDPTPRIGLMAQDVEKRDPGAVVEIGGVKYVDYARALAGAKAAALHSHDANAGPSRGADGRGVRPAGAASFAGRDNGNPGGRSAVASAGVVP